MHPDLKTRRRMLVHASIRYARSDRALARALDDARQFVPDITVHSVLRIGQPGSRIRQLYDARHAAMERLQVARLKFEIARARLAP